ncbi:MAG: M20/M25/M40 family metallo-hydrolase [Bacteroidales bacterium]|nr:M20/M25/M40 family metallo-hydrolase [Bacteroidales bacterium]
MKPKNCLFIMGLLPFILSHGQVPGIEQSIHDLVKKQTEAIYDSLVIIRRDIHMNPELPGQEKMTSEKIAAYLESLGLEVRKKIGGHDVHTVIGLGIASVLARNRERLTGTVYFIFQPSEENYGGAKAMIDYGLFRIISP